MQPIGTMLRRTSQQVRRQQEALSVHARKASQSVTSETRTVGRELVGAVRGEADAWRKYVRDTVAAAGTALTPHSMERTLLMRTSLALRSLDARVRGRLRALETSRQSRAKTRRTNGAAKARTKRQAAASIEH